MDVETTFPLRYWINLGRRQDRRFETEFALLHAGITAERFPAIDARFVRKTRGYATRGRYALALTQRMLLRRADLRGASAVLIMEDDVVFHPDLQEKLREIDLPDDWGIFYLGCAHQTRPEPAGKGIVRTKYALDTHAFAVRDKYYRAVMAALSVNNHDDVAHARASDWFLANLHETIPTYACYPNLAWQAVQQSDLADGVYSNYTRSGEQISGSGEMIGIQAEMWGTSRWSPHKQNRPSERQGTNSVECGPDKRRTMTEPKLGLLFLTRGDVHQPEIWHEFIKEADSDVRVFSHPKHPAEVSTGFLADTVIAKHHETSWGDISLVRAMLDLLATALRDPTLTHFAFLSESCIPVRPWAEMKRRLILDPRSMLDIANSDNMKAQHRDRIAGVKDLPDSCRRGHSQWSLLDREAASCICESDFTEKFANISAPDEHYFGSILALRGFEENSKINRNPLTWVKWTEERNTTYPIVHDRITPATIFELTTFTGFFARKFTESSDIGEWGLHRAGTQSHQIIEKV